jgi:hypothetical protein
MTHMSVSSLWTLSHESTGCSAIEGLWGTSKPSVANLQEKPRQRGEAGLLQQAGTRAPENVKIRNRMTLRAYEVGSMRPVLPHCAPLNRGHS